MGTILVYYDAGCGVCSALARLVSRWDGRHRILFVPNDDASRPAQFNASVYDATIVVVEEGSGRTWTRASGIARILRALPGGAPIAFWIEVPGFHWFANRFYDWFSRNRGRISAQLGFQACALPISRSQKKGSEQK